MAVSVGAWLSAGGAAWNWEKRRGEPGALVNRATGRGSPAGGERRRPGPAVSEMSRWLWPWSKCVKERVCRYLLHHYLGHFFQEHLSLDQLSLDLYKGSVALRDIHLEIWVRNWARVRTEKGTGPLRPEAPGERVGPRDQIPGVLRPWMSNPFLESEGPS